MSDSRIRLAVLISGGGRTLLNLNDRIRAGRLDAVIAGVISSRSDVKGVERARDAGLPVTIVSRREMAAAAYQQALTTAVDALDADLVCMAGFLSLWHIPERYQGRAINIHPALLPEFGGPGMYGLRVHQAVLDARRTESGCTVHYCDNEYDHGPIILQSRVPVLPGDTADTLAARVFEAECEAYPEAIERLCAHRAK